MRICVDKNVALQPQIQWMNVVVDLVVALFCGRRSVNIKPGRIPRYRQVGQFPSAPAKQWNGHT